MPSLCSEDSEVEDDLRSSPYVAATFTELRDMWTSGICTCNISLVEEVILKVENYEKINISA